MKVQEVCRAVIRTSGLTQKDIAERHGKSGQSTISMMFQSKSMRVEGLLMILNDCGYDLIARSRNKDLPNYVIGDETNEDYLMNEARFDRLRDIVREVVQEELKKADCSNDVDGEERGEAWKEYLKESAKKRGGSTTTRVPDI
jgi:transcriptional regulator with XRE-family HTH domain